MIRSILVDDEFKSRESLKILLTDFVDNIEVCALCADVQEAVQAIELHQPDVVFLDIQLQRETGFDLLTRVKKIDFEVVFTTAYSEYAIKAFRFSAIDYLLKPIDIVELKKSVAKVDKRVNDNFSGRLEQLMQNLKTKPTQQSKLALPTLDGLFFVKVNEIVYCEASSNYTNIYLSDGKKYVVSRTLKEYEEMLEDHNFFRIHHSYLVNTELIKKYVRGEGGYVVMQTDVSLDVSKRKKEAFLEYIGNKG